MTAPGGKTLSGGLQRAVLFELDTNGYPAASGTTAYEGMEVIGPKAFDLTIPDVTKIVHKGNDRVLATQFLPPGEGATAQLHVASADNEINAALTGVKEYTIAEMSMMSWVTDQQGNEPNVGALMVEASLNAVSKLGTRKFYIFPAARAIPRAAPMPEAAAAETLVDMALNPSTKHLWGTALGTGTEGAGEAAFDSGESNYRPNLVAFKGNNSNTVFLLPTDKPAVATANMKVWKDGAVQAPTLATTSITFSSAPGTGAIVVCLYEY